MACHSCESRGGTFGSARVDSEGEETRRWKSWRIPHRACLKPTSLFSNTVSSEAEGVRGRENLHGPGHRETMAVHTNKTDPHPTKKKKKAHCTFKIPRAKVRESESGAGKISR